MRPLDQDATGAREYIEASIISALAVQIPALFFIDLLGQSLMRRVRDERLLATDDLFNQLGDGVCN